MKDDGSTGLHEAGEDLSPDLLDRHRAIRSLMEEMEAVDWYDQRAAAASCPELRAILEHNRDEEKEHAAMVIEWLRRNDTRFGAELETYLHAEGSVIEVEEGAAGAPASTSAASTSAASTSAASTSAASTSADESLGIGTLRKEENR